MRFKVQYWLCYRMTQLILYVSYSVMSYNHTIKRMRFKVRLHTSLYDDSTHTLCCLMNTICCVIVFVIQSTACASGQSSMFRYMMTQLILYVCFRFCCFIQDNRLCFAMTDGKVCVVDMTTGDILSRYFEHTTLVLIT